MDFLYGKNAILSALMNNRRNFAQLYLYSNPSSTQQQQQQLTAIDSAKLNEIKRLCAERRVRIQPVMSRNRLSAMIGSSEGMRQHQGVVLECSPLPVLDFNDDVVIANRLNSTKRQRPQPRPHVLVYLDKITDAFNIGAIARNAAFFGVDTLLLSDGCAPVNNVVAATSVGAVDQLELYRVASSSLLLSAERFGDRLSLFAGSLPTSTSTTTTITDLNDVVRSDVNIVMLGSEGKGISRSLLNSRYVKQFYISGSTTLMNQQQQRQPLDSLNVAVSCGIALHAFTRPSQKSVEIYGKAEFLSVGGSVKDRPVVQMLKDAQLPFGSTVVEATAGNTGSALCQLSRAFGLKVVLTCPEKVAPSKKQQLRALGAELIVCPDCKPSDERHFTNVAARLAVERNALFLNQFENPSNSRAHHLTTGPEIIASLGKDVLLACCTGTGGTAAGIGQALFEANGGKRALCVMAIRGQPLTFSLEEKKFVQRDADVVAAEGSSDLEGVGASKLFKNIVACEPYVELSLIAGRDGDSIAAAMCRWLVEKEGLFLGGSAGMNVCTAVVAAKLLAIRGVKRPVVTILCDGGERYLNKQYNDEWLREKQPTISDSLLRPTDLTFLNPLLALNGVDPKDFFHATK